ncbi:proteobacterial dedicated sortase system response regulator [Thiolapillus sp.]
MARIIAIVEDEEDIRANYAELFRRQGYEVQTYADRQEALTGFSTRLPDLAILDIGLGDEFDGGFELCRELRSLSPVLPIIFLSARDSDIDMVSGLRLGADDYLTKDISLPHLSARVAALFRRVDAMSRDTPRNDHLVQGDLELDMDRLSARWKGQPVELTVTELWMLHALARHPGHVKSREQLMEAANIVVEPATITSHIRRMRARFCDLDENFDQIESVYGIGYRWKESASG